jgi:hypothetical protein
LKLLPEPYCVLYYEMETTIDMACYSILSLLPDNDDSQLVIGFEVKFSVDISGMGSQRKSPVDVIQIAYGDSAYVFKVVRIHLYATEHSLSSGTHSH